MPEHSGDVRSVVAKGSGSPVGSWALHLYTRGKFLLLPVMQASPPITCPHSNAVPLATASMASGCMQGLRAARSATWECAPPTSTTSQTCCGTSWPLETAQQWLAPAGGAALAASSSSWATRRTPAPTWPSSRSPGSCP